MELTGRERWRAEIVAAGRRNRVVDTAAAAGRDCGARGGRQLIAQPLDGDGRSRMVRGSCLCGGVRFQVNGPVAELQNCHCSQCRKAYGSAFGTVAIVEARHFAYLEGTPLIASYKQSERVTRYFCSKCGSPLPIAEAWDPLVGIPAGVLDDDPGKRPSAHIFVASKAPWWEITDGAPQYRE